MWKGWISIIGFTTIFIFCTRALDAQIDPELLAGMKARSIGPAAMSGRIAAIDAVESDPDIIYIGAATGGVWKSVNSGLTWTPVFDDQPVAAIGEVKIFQPSPDILWVGTGESNVRNSASVGNGIYRSLDSGLTWTHLGLKETERISRICLHPTDPDMAWVAAMGRLWGENTERGVFKTTDGGKTWKKVLYVDPRTGAADLVIDPENPLKLIAAMWDYRRWPWFFRSGGPGSGLFITYDGGETWKERTAFDGLPDGELGRIGLAIAPSDPKIVYALVESKKIGLYKSLDGGESWALASEDRRVGNRPFYYADIRVDPLNPDRVYSLWSVISCSKDGGKTFENLVSYGEVHPDHHALWINPRDPTHMVNGNDGGIYISRDQGKTWWFARTLPLGQYYHIRVDNAQPYNVYGGMQDNGSWRGPAYLWGQGGIRNFHWQELYYGDGFDTLPDPEDCLRGYAMSQGGQLSRYNLRTGESRSIKPAPADDVELRFNWNAALAIDPFDPETLYFGSQFVHKSTDRGESWTVISPDLTTNNPEWQKQKESGGLTLDVTTAENFTSLVTIAPSPVLAGVIWAGSDDGRLHLTRDNGNLWISVEKNVPQVPENTWIPHIAPSPHDGDTAFAVFDDHRRSNWTPYVFETRDSGKTWKSLATESIRGYALVVEQDRVNPDLLFLGTEFGLYISLDHGASWFPWTHGLPTVSVMDLVVHPKEHDLVLGTHGRSAYIIDDIRPLRSLSAEVMQAPLHLFSIPPAQQYKPSRSPSTRSVGTNEFFGENKPYGALITFCVNMPDLPHPDPDKERARKEALQAAAPDKKEGNLLSEEEEKEADHSSLEENGENEESEEGDAGREKKDKGEKASFQVLDHEGKVISTFEAGVHQGLNRAVWDLRTDPFKSLPRPGRPKKDKGRGPEVVPGTYTMKIKFRGQEMQSPVEVLADPRSPLPEEVRQANFAARVKLGQLRNMAVEAVDRIEETRRDINAIIDRVKVEGDGDKKAGVDDDGTEVVAEEPSGEQKIKEIDSASVDGAENKTDGRSILPQEENTAQVKEQKDTQRSELLKEARELNKELDRLEKRFRDTNKTQAILWEENVMTYIHEASSSVGSTWEAPGATDLRYMEIAETALHDAVLDLNDFFAEKLSHFRERIRTEAIVFLPVIEPISVDNKDETSRKGPGDHE
ncbi:MAG: hypothetical protein ABIK28_25245 [Planctomycetota bacterium]